MKKSTRRTMMMSSLAMLLVAVLALGTATYAWFTAASTGRIQNIEFSATSADGISLSKTGLPGTYKSTLDFADYYGENAEVTLAPVSIANAANANFAVYSGLFNEDDQTITTSVVNTPGGSYFLMPVYVWNSGSNDINVYMSDATVEAVGSIRTDLATRIGVVAYNNTVAYDTLASDSNMDTIFTAFGDSFIYEPNADTHLDSSVSGNEYHAVIAAAASQATTGSNNHIIANGEPAVGGVTTTAKTCGIGNTDMVTVPGGSVMKVLIYIWIEGQDIDCFNEIAAGHVKIEIVFAK